MIRFLDPPMLLFGLAAAVPPIIAWLGRRGVAVREWAAMEILARAAGRTAFRRRCVDWLVVAMRSAMLLAVAFAAARPLLVPNVLPINPDAEGVSPRGRRVVVFGEATAVAAAIEAASPPLAPVRSIAESRLDDEPFETASLVVLADGVVPGPAAARRLGRFVDRGGAVAVLVGPRTTDGRAAVFNRFVGGLAGVGIDGVIDCLPAVPVGDAPTGETVRLTASAEGNPATDLAGPTVRRMARLVAGQGIPGAAVVPRRSPTVLAQAEPSGDPIAVRIGVGSGGVGLVAVPLAIEGWSGGAWAENGSQAARGAPAWTDLPAWPVFVPFVESTILSLTTAGTGAGGDRGAGSVGWLAGRNLSGLALVVALSLVLLDPLVSRAVSLRSPLR